MPRRQVLLVSLLAGSAFGQSCTPQWLSGGIPNPNGTVFSTIMWDRDIAGPLPPVLVAGGSFTLAGTTAVSNLAFWDGVAWFDLGGGVNGASHGATAVNALAVMADGDLAVGGSFDGVGAGPGAVTANCIARYNGSVWSTLGLGLINSAATVTSLSTRNNGDLLAIGGLFTNNDFTQVGPLARWNDAVAVWTAVAPSYPEISSLRVVKALANGDVVIGGIPSSAPAGSALWRWSDAQNMWLGYGTGVKGTAPLNQVFAILESAGGDLVIGGNFTIAGGVSANSIARWDGSQFVAFGTGITNPSNPSQLAVRALSQMPNGDIVAGGQFDTAGGNVGGRIARWDGSSWMRLPQGAGDIIWTLLRTPYNELIIGGAYTFAGGSFANKRIARFADSPVPWAAHHPQPQSLPDHSTLSLSAACAVSFLNVTFRWQRDGIDIADGQEGASPGGGIVSGASGSLSSPTAGAPITLEILDARAGDSGEYTVIFTNSCGSGTSLAAAVEIVGEYCPADYNEDGGIDGADVEAFFTDWEAGSSAADVNQDGGIDGGDVETFFAAWEAGGC